MKNTLNFSSLLDELPELMPEVVSVLSSFEIGDLFVEQLESRTITTQDGRVDNNLFNNRAGFSVRGVYKDKTFFLSSDILSLANINAKLKELHNIAAFSAPNSSSLKFQGLMTGTLYDASFVMPSEIECLEILDELHRSLSSYNIFKSIYLNLSTSIQKVLVIREDGACIYDDRPMWAIRVQAIVQEGKRSESIRIGISRRSSIKDLKSSWSTLVFDIVRKAENILKAQKAPMGQMPVLLSNGSCATLIHEAIGHALEADSHVKRSSCFAGMLNSTIANECVTIVDTGIEPHMRGSINFDDEGMPSQRTVLVEQGVLKNLMCDRFYGKKLNMSSTGSGRRESFMHLPYPRMRSTLLETGTASVEDLLSSMKYGIYALDFTCGEVNVISGQFSFSSSEAFLVENGQKKYPIKGCTFIGNGPETLKNIVAVCNDYKLDETPASCGKEGQWVPVGVGQPSLLVSSLTIGGEKS